MTGPDTKAPADWYSDGKVYSITKDSLARTLAAVPLFAGLSRQDLKAVAALAEVRRYDDGVAVVRLGEHGGGLHVVLGGGGAGTAGRRPGAGTRARRRLR